MNKPWGNYKVLLDSEYCKVKVITVYPGERLSLQRHFKRTEHWFIVQGKALVTIGNKKLLLLQEDHTNISVEEWHRIENTGEEDLVFIEIQTGSYFGEDDIERKDDDYGRAK